MELCVALKIVLHLGFLGKHFELGKGCFLKFFIVMGMMVLFLGNIIFVQICQNGKFGIPFQKKS